MAPRLRVLVVGVGALGCEMLTKLVAHGCKDLEIVDMDTIELSNLSRQLLFRAHDVDRPKAVVAATRIATLFPQVQCVPRVQRVETLPPAYFEQFNLIFCGVDNAEARLWLNAVVCSAIHPIVLVEGGIEGLMGHVRLVIPRVTPCLYCTRYLHVEERHELPLCTLAGTPRTREHCLGWALSLAWPKRYPFEFDPADPHHLVLLTSIVQAQAQEKGIAGADAQFVETSVRQLVPAVVSTCALIAGVAVLVGLASVTAASLDLKTDNYWFYNGVEGAFLQSHSLHLDPDCLICRGQGPSNTLTSL